MISSGMITGRRTKITQQTQTEAEISEYFQGLQSHGEFLIFGGTKPVDTAAGETAAAKRL